MLFNYAFWDNDIGINCGFSGLQELASVANMNPSYFCRFFRSITHQSPMNYVNMYRIEKVAQLLHRSNRSTMDICMECGFNEYSNFIKVFKKYKGITPKQYRETEAFFTRQFE